MTADLGPSGVPKRYCVLNAERTAKEQDPEFYGNRSTAITEFRIKNVINVGAALFSRTCFHVYCEFSCYRVGHCDKNARAFYSST